MSAKKSISLGDYIVTKQIGKGIANSKKKAEQLASLEALKMLGKL